MTAIVPASTAAAARSGRRWPLVVLSFALVAAAAGAVSWYRRQPDEIYRQGLAAISRRDLVALRETSRKLQARSRGSARASLLLGAAVLWSDDPARALPLLKRAADDPETQWRAKLLGGEAFCRLQEYESAILTLEEVVGHSPDEVDAHRWLASAYFDMGSLDQATTHLQRVAELAPEDPRPHRMIGYILADVEQYHEAVEAYEVSIRRSRSHAGIDEVLAELASVQLKLHRYGDALTTLADVRAQPQSQVLRAEALYGLGRTDAARQILDALGQTDQLPSALVLRGLMLLDDGRPQPAVDLLRRAVELRPDDFETRFKFVQALAQSGETEPARREMEEVERIKRVRLKFAELLTAAQVHPQDAELRFRLGELCEQLGRPELAQKWYRAALSADPAHAGSLQRIRRNLH